MAFNLWKAAGFPVSYNPLPLGTNTYTNIVGIGDYVLKFRAKSVSGAQLRFTNWAIQQTVNTVVNLTSDFQTFSLPFYQPVKQSIYLYDINNKGDIIIDSIELVQKPLSKLTINGIDGFKSGKWALHANAVVVDDETLVLNATGTGQSSVLIIPSLPNQQYAVSAEVTQTAPVGLLDIYSVDSVGASTWLNAVSIADKIRVVTTPSNSKQLRITCSSNAIGTFTFKRPMLNLGTIPAPTYSKKTGDKMVMPVPVGNLFDGALQLDKHYDSTGVLIPNTGSLSVVNFIPVKPNTTYTISHQYSYPNSALYVNFHDVAKAHIRRDNTTTGTFTTPSNCYFIHFFWSAIGNGSINSQIMLNEGTTATPYKPYAVQVNAKPKRYVPKKNLISGLYGYDSNGGNVTNTKYVTSATYKGFLEPVQPNTVYTVSKDRVGIRFRYFFYDVNPVLNTTLSIGGNYMDSVNSFTFTTPSNAKYVFVVVGMDSEFNWVQFEQGATATPYEPYTPIIPRAKTGLSFNGVTDYLQLPSMTMDSIEIDCLIDSVQPQSNPFLLDARPGLANGYLTKGGNVGSGFSTLTVDGINKPSKLWADLPLGQRTKIKLTANTFTASVFLAGYSILCKATLYKVTCYLAGTIVAQYDFEKPGNIVGDKVLQNAKNLIPIFEDARWSLHANTQVLGKDYLRLNATAGFQDSTLILDTKPSNSYLFSSAQPCRIRIDELNADGSFNKVVVNSTLSSYSFTVTAGYKLKVMLTSSATGSYDFIKPSLYQLDSKEGTIVGNPAKLNKSSKRKLYRKR